MVSRAKMKSTRWHFQRCRRRRGCRATPPGAGAGLHMRRCRPPCLGQLQHQKPTPFLKLGNGRVGIDVGLPGSGWIGLSMAKSASSPSARRRRGEDRDLGGLTTRRLNWPPRSTRWCTSSLLRPPLAEYPAQHRSQDQRATMRTAAPAPMPISRLVTAAGGVSLSADVRGGRDPALRRSVPVPGCDRATAVACCIRFNSRAGVSRRLHRPPPPEIQRCHGRCRRFDGPASGVALAGATAAHAIPAAATVADQQGRREAPMPRMSSLRGWCLGRRVGQHDVAVDAHAPGRDDRAQQSVGKYLRRGQGPHRLMAPTGAVRCRRLQ